MTMIILHAGGTADTGDLNGGCYENYDNAIGGISRGNIRVDPGTNYGIKARDPSTGARTSFTKGWVHFVWYTRWSQGGGAYLQNFYNAAGVNVIRATTTSNSTTFTWKLMSSPDGVTWTDIPGAVGQEPGEGLRTVDYSIDCEAGKIAYYRNGVALFDVAAPNLVGLDVSSATLHNANDSWYGYQQTLIATGESTIGCNVRTRYAVGAGDDADWTGTFADVDEWPYNDGDFITADTVGQRESFTANDLPALAASNEVKGVVMAARFRNNGGAPANIKPYLKIGDTRYPTPSFPDASAGWTAGQGVFLNNPATGAAWGKDINTVNVQFGVEAAE